ncbi:MAG: tRNA uridine-5-carboxymethylaminomethyl(34) synthesis GTPase MnmE [Deltaproteobacteria bacterium]|jgi:tRNA modification GTPase|nr:tRNA uridine-5-carboxymethylaminomethyl(34) synthesis GTPase MnmE [Deltaproteobacteria bacterium]
MYLHDTIVAPATASGPAALAIVRISGPRALELLHRVWRGSSGAELAPRKLVLGRIYDPGTEAALDQALAVYMPAPRSFTGEDVVELHCHGGDYVVRRVTGLVVGQGARFAERGEFTRRAFLNGRLDLSQAEAIADLVAARSDRALKLALDGLAGVLAARVSRLRARSIAVRARLEAQIDFPDEDLPAPCQDELLASLAELRADVGLLLDSFRRGQRIRDGARVAIVGKPNAGKSSILNLLLGSERAIVTAVPGTTRDLIEASISLGGDWATLIDTAGIRDAANEVEEIGIQRALKAAAEADLLLAVFDSSTSLEPDDRHVIQLTHGRAGLGILNKSDLPAKTSREQLRAAGLQMPTLRLSALRAESAPVLRDGLSTSFQSLDGDTPSDSLSISRERHRLALEQAKQSLERACKAVKSSMPPEVVTVDLNAASNALASITGEITNEDVLDRIFSEFCVGK